MEETPVAKLFDELGVIDKDREEVEQTLHKVEKSFINLYVAETTGPTHGTTLEVVNVFKIERPGCKVGYRFNLENRRLLWHGTSSYNVYKILRDGFDLKRARAEAMFGPGIYFSDCVTKAMNYARASNGHAFLFLCEVALGDIHVMRTANKTAKEAKGQAHSVLGEGRMGTRGAENGQFCYEVMLRPGPLQDFNNGNTLQYNEYIVYETNQIQLRYLVKVKFTQVANQA